MNDDELLNLEPKLVWKYFNELRKIPRCSKHEEKAAEFVLKTVKALGYEAIMDSVRNVLTRIPATSGYEDKAPICLQVHLDIVCDKNSDIVHDFSKDPIDAYVDGEYVTAKGTTLGADNGIGAAIILALIEDMNCKHPRFECLFTVDEETGMTGAFQLDTDLLTAKRYINLDSGETGKVTIGCAGGGDTELYLPIKKVQTPDTTGLLVKIHGLKGGHSGVDIHLGRANALKLLARLIYRLMQSDEIGISCISGGNKRNAIPREAEALITVKDITNTRNMLKKAVEDFQIEYEGKEDNITLEVIETPVNDVIVDSTKVIQLLLALPHGARSMNTSIEGLTDTSSNLAIVSTSETQVEIYQMTRSSMIAARDDARRIIEATGQLAGAEVLQKGEYPSWRPDVNSTLLKQTKEYYHELYGTEIKVTATHGGLETAIIGNKYPDMEMISMGPTINFPHSPDEQVHIPSVMGFYEFIKGLLSKI